MPENSELNSDDTDNKALIVKAQKLTTCRKASKVVPELDACFATLSLGTNAENNVVPLSRQAK